MMIPQIIPLIITVCAAGAIAVTARAVSRDRHPRSRAGHWLLAIAGGTSLLFSLLPVFGVPRAVPGSSFDLAVLGDHAAVPALAACIIFFASCIFYLSSRERPTYDVVLLVVLLVLLLLFSMVLLVVTDFLVVFSLVKACTGITVGLVLASRDRKAPGAALKFVVMAVIGGFLQLYGLSIMSRIVGGTDFTMFKTVPGLDEEGTQHAYISFFFIIAGFGTEIGIFPFHWWIPGVYTSSPAYVLAFLNIKTMVYGVVLAKFITLFNMILPAALVQGTCIILGFASMLAGGMLAFQQRGIMHAIAYLSIYEFGCFLMGMSSPSLDGHLSSLFYLINGIFMKVGLVFIAGRVQESGSIAGEVTTGGSRYMDKMVPLAFIICSLSLGGTPPFSGFFAKWLFIEHLLAALATTTSLSWAVIIVTAIMVVSLLILVGLMRHAHVLLYGPETPRPPGVPAGQYVAPYIMVAVAILLGVFPALTRWLFFPG